MTEQENITRHKLRTVIAEADLFNMPYIVMDQIANEGKKLYTHSNEQGVIHKEPL